MKIIFWSSEFTAKISLKNILDLLIEFTYLMVIFLVPLWFAYWFPTYHIFEFNKLVVFQVLTLFLLFFTMVKIIFYPPISVYRSLKFFKKYWLIPTIFIIGLSLTLLSSLNPSLSFYGLMDRQAGLVSYLFYFLWFILVSFNILSVNNVNNRKNLSLEGDELNNDKPNKVSRNLKRVIVVMVISGTLVAFYGVLQILNIDFLVWTEPPWLTHRIFSTLGQPNFLASWLLLIIPLSFYLFWENRKFLLKFVYLLAFGLQLIALFLTGSRAGLLASFFIGLIFLSYLFIKSSWSRVKKYLIAIAFIFLLIASLWGLNDYLPGRVTKLIKLDSGSINVRLNFYQAASSAILKRPLRGYGLENSGSVFIKYYRPEWGVYGNVGQNTDRAHDIILDILLTTGAFGLVLYSLYYYFFFSLFRDNLKNKRLKSLNLALGLGAIAYLFFLLFNFSVITTEVYFWLFLAILVVINFNSEKSSNLVTFKTLKYFKGFDHKIKIFFKLIAVLIISILIFWQLQQVLRSLIADYYFNSSYIALTRTNYLSALVLAEDMLKENPNPVNLATYNLRLGDRLLVFYPQVTNPGIKNLVKEKLLEINRSLPAQAYKNLLFKAKLALVLSNFSPAKVYLYQLVSQTPYWPPTYLVAGKLALVQGNFPAALAYYHLAILNLPSPSDKRLNSQHHRNVLAYQYLATKQIAKVYEAQGKYASAEKYYKLAYSYDPADFTLFKNIADTYYQRGDFSSAIKYLQRGENRSPKDYHWPLALAISFKDSGNYNLAKVYIVKALKLAPQNQELLNFQNKISE